jgi:hypothetical protein
MVSKKFVAKMLLLVGMTVAALGCDFKSAFLYSGLPNATTIRMGNLFDGAFPWWGK